MSDKRHIPDRGRRVRFTITSFVCILLVCLPILGERFNPAIYQFTGATSSSAAASPFAQYHRLTWTPQSTVSACTSIALEVSSDGVAWVSAIAPTACTAQGVGTSTSMTARYYRITVVGLTGGYLLVSYGGYDINPSGAGVSAVSVTSGTINSSTVNSATVNSATVNSATISQMPAVTVTSATVNLSTISQIPAITQTSGTVNSATISQMPSVSVTSGTIGSITMPSLTVTSGTIGSLPSVSVTSGTIGQITMPSLTVTSGTVQANQGTAANVTAGWPNIGGYITTSTALTSASPNDTTIGLNVQGYGAVTVQHNPSGTIATGVITFEGRTSTASPYIAIYGARMDNASAAIVNSFAVSNAAMVYSIPVGGMSDFRIRLNPALTNTGTDNLYIGASGFGRDSWNTQNAATNNVSANISQYGGVNVSTANPFFDGGRASTDTRAAVADAAAVAQMLDKWGRTVIVFAPQDLMGSATASVTTTAAAQILASSGGANYKWAITSLMACNRSGTVAGLLQFTDSTGTLATFPWTQTATTAGESRCYMQQFPSPLLSAANTTISIKANIANATGFDGVITAYKTGT